MKEGMRSLSLLIGSSRSVRAYAVYIDDGGYSPCFSKYAKIESRTFPLSLARLSVLTSSLPVRMIPINEAREAEKYTAEREIYAEQVLLPG